MGENRPSPEGPAPMPGGHCASEPWRKMHVAPCWPQGRQAGLPPTPARGALPPAPCPSTGLVPAAPRAHTLALPMAGPTVSEPATGRCSLTSAFRPNTSSPSHTAPQVCTCPKTPAPSTFHHTLVFPLLPAFPAARGRHELWGSSAQAV